MIKDNGGPAFPHDAYQPMTSVIYEPASQGMAMRDYFAGQALALVKWDLNPKFEGKRMNEYTAELANAAYQIADAMLAERKKE